MDHYAVQPHWKPDSSVALSRGKRWILTLVLLIPTVGCAVLLGLTISGHLLEIQSFECGSSEQDADRLQKQTRMMNQVIAPSLLLCLTALGQVWMRSSCILKMKMFILGTSVVSLTVLFFVTEWTAETQEGEEFKKRYLALLPLIETNDRQGNCSYLYNIYQWQAEYKCCGLINGYQDWNSSIPDSCSCDRGDGNTTCVEVYNTTLHSDEQTQHNLVYEKPCLPVVLSCIGESRTGSVFWKILTCWIIIVGIFSACFTIFILIMIVFCTMIIVEECSGQMTQWKCRRNWKRNGGEEMVPAVYVRKPTTNDNYETEEENGKEGTKHSVVRDEEEGTKGEGEAEVGDNPVRFIPISELRRLQEVLDPPPFQLQARCMCLFSMKTKPLYVILIDKDSPLLPSRAVLIDAIKLREVFWAEGHHVFVVIDKLPGLDH